MAALKFRIFQTLSHRPVFVLWLSQSFSAIGDEVFKAAIYWLAVGISGPAAGFIGAAQFGASFVFGIVGGTWADHWDPRRTMVCTDILQTGIVLIPVIWAHFYGLNFWVLLIIATVSFSLKVLSRPAMLSLVPQIVSHRDLLQATNGLMNSTQRLARAMGPAFIGLVSEVLPKIHLLTFNSITFLLSAVAVGSQRSEPRVQQTRQQTRMGFVESSLLGLRMVRTSPALSYSIYSRGICNGLWSFYFQLGIAHLVQKEFPGDIRMFSLLLGAYGAGNVVAAFVLSNLKIINQMKAIVIGYCWLGMCMVALAYATNIYLMLLLTALSSFGPPLYDLAQVDHINMNYKAVDLLRLMRYRIAIESGGVFTCLFASAFAYKYFEPRLVIGVAGFFILVVGVFGSSHARRTQQGT